MGTKEWCEKIVFGLCTFEYNVLVRKGEATHRHSEPFVICFEPHKFVVAKPFFVVAKRFIVAKQSFVAVNKDPNFGILLSSLL